MIAITILLSAFLLQMISAVASIRVFRQAGSDIGRVVATIAALAIGIPTLVQLYLALTGHGISSANLIAIAYLGASIVLALSIRGLAARHRHTRLVALALSEAEQRFRTLFDRSSEGIFVTDWYGNIIEANGQAAQIVGYAPAELVRRNVREFVPAELLAIIPSRLADLRGGQRLEGRLSLRTKDGGEAAVEVNCCALSHDRLLGLMRSLPTKDSALSRKSEHELIDSRERYRILTEAAFEGIVVLDRGKVIDANEQVLVMHGYTRNEVIGRPAGDFVSAEDRALVAAKIGRDSEEPYEYRARRKDGSTFPASARPRTVRTNDHVIRITAIQDITERKRSEQAILESRQRYQSLVDVAGNAIIGLVENGRVFEFNGEAERILNRERSDVIGQNFVDQFVPETLREQFCSDLQRALAGERVRDVEYRVWRADGSARLLRWNFAGLPSGEDRPRAVIAVAEDITDSRKSQQAMRESEQRFRTMADFAPFMMWVSDALGQFIYFSQSWLRFRGLPAEREIGSGWLDGVHPDDLNRWRERFAEATSTQSSLDVEIRLRRYDGDYRWMLVRGAAHFGSDKCYMGHVGSCIDIADRKQSEDRLALLNRWFLDLGADPEKNIQKLTELCGQLIKADCALYNRLDQGKLCAMGHWQAPPDFQLKDKPDGHICHDVILRQAEDVLVIRNLEATPYASSDPNVARYGLKTYVGKAVKWGEVRIGSLCAVYLRDFNPAASDRRMLEIISAAISIEEERLHAHLSLKESDERFRVALLGSPMVVFQQDRNLRYTWIHNPLMGLSRETVLGKTDSDLFDTAGATRLTEIKRRVLATGIGCRELVTVAVGGRQHRFDLIVEPIGGDDAESAGITGAAYDVGSMPGPSGEQARRVSGDRDAISDLAHKLNNCLVPIIGYTEMALSDLQDGREMEEQLREVLSSANQARDLLEQVTSSVTSTSERAGMVRRDSEPVALSEESR